ncbi:hypothetical protein EKN06_00255 [Croceicoccus ponticola]|uniref:Uncharacterized protein n=1 Tax=Croceicoccus ponticola TaxID=2217664 RepID=A0A437GZD2_9SPHN|nr:hypothetical protein [Croceicoccus ponticola]RVQ68703.1 hypothetical protein EKN06_00255 [Croceicoccus ponticola]
MRNIILPVISLVLLAACDPAPEEDNTGTEAPQAPQAPVSTPEAVDPGSLDAPPPEPLAVKLTRNEWATAANKDVCAPLVLTSDGGASAEARRANFAGGWGVAFDTEKVRSAYGVAGPGIVDADGADGQEDRLKGQWPHFMRLPDLPQPAFAGFGLEGARPYREDRPDGVGDNSLAYVRVAGQDCTYNVWSRLGRAHLEVLLSSLRPGLED